MFARHVWTNQRPSYKDRWSELIRCLWTVSLRNNNEYKLVQSIEGNIRYCVLVSFLLPVIVSLLFEFSSCSRHYILKIQHFWHSCFPDIATGVIKRKTLCNVIKYHRNMFFYMLCSVFNKFCWILELAIKHLFREDGLFWICLVQLYVHP